MYNVLKRSRWLAAALLVLTVSISACASGDPVSVSEVENQQPAESNDEMQPVTGNSSKLNLNSVSGDELLATIPGFGNRMVREFHEYRPYISIQQFRREIGKYVDDAQVSEYEQYVYVPIDINESDAETLKQIPGVDEALAESLSAARPFDSNAAFIEVLGESLADDELATAERYLQSE